MTRAIGYFPKTMLVAAVTVLAGLSARSLMASTVYVGACVANVTSYSTISAAVTAVKAGSTIRVCPGNDPEQIVINKNLTLTGYDSGTADNPVVVIPSVGSAANTTSLAKGGPIAAQILVEYPATNVTISYLAVDGSNSNLNSGCSEPPLLGVYFRGNTVHLSKFGVFSSH